MIKTDHIKYILDGTAIGVALTRWFQIVPWPDIAAFLSVVWLTLQISHWIWKRWRKRNE